MPPRAARDQALGVEEFAQLVAARVIELLAAPRVLDPGHLTVKQLSRELGVPIETLRDWRSQDRGPAYIRGESKGDKATILYPRSEVEAWKKRQLVVPVNP